MNDALTQYGPVGAVAVVLAGVVAYMVRRWNGGRPAGEGRHRSERCSATTCGREDLVALREDVRDVRRCVDDIRDRFLQQLVTDVAVLRTRVEHLERPWAIGHSPERGA